MASAAYALARIDVDVWVEIEALDKLAIVTGRIISHIAVELSGNVVVIKYSAYDSPLGRASMVSI
jgi:hypothetical protein